MIGKIPWEIYRKRLKYDQVRKLLKNPSEVILEYT
jgi:hypothetical protein